MKINKLFAIAAGILMLAACSDFEEINKNPKAAGASDLKPYWALNKSIVADQQNPNDAERVFVLYWADIARQDGENGGRAVGRSNDEWAGCLYGITRSAITSASTAIRIADEAIEGGELGARDAAFFANIKAYARIWRVHLMAEFVDSFGCFTTDFESTSPEYKSVEDCYKFMYAELAESVAAIDLNYGPSSKSEQDGDPAYQLDPLKWKNYGVSLWMRLAMRLSEVQPATAKAEFEKALAAGDGIRTIEGTFRVLEGDGWNDLTAVMSRSWDWQETSAAMANLMTNLGGAKAEDILTDPGKRFYKDALTSAQVAETYGPYIKDASAYLGVHMVGKKFKDVGKKDYTIEQVDLCEVNSDNPTAGYFFDGIPSRIDPRAFVFYCLPGDAANRKEVGPAFMSANKPYKIVDGEEVPDGHYTKTHLSRSHYTEVLNEGTKNEKTVYHYADDTMVDATFAWNGLPLGYGYDEKSSFNALISSSGDPELNGNGYGVTYPSLAQRYRQGGDYRVFFGPWETYFLLAEAAVRGWNAGIGAEAAYNTGIKLSFEYLNVEANYDAYINSEDYNRVGTSVKFSHTAEPANYQIDYYDPISKTTKKTEYKYPVASKTLYGKALNDQLTKIITQKYIANTPWLPLESWSDHRRTGLPFFEMPVSSTEFPFLDGWTKESYKTGQKVGFYAQRMNYPNSFKNANPEEYQKAVGMMNMTDENTVTPLWWAIQK